MAWVVATVRRLFGAENRACLNLANAGFEAWVPKSENDHHREFVLFPGYVLINSLIGSFSKICFVRGIKTILSNNGKPSLIPDQKILELRSLQDENGLILLPKRPPRFALGERVRLMNGPFKDHVGIYQGMTREQRENVLIDWLGRKIRITLEQDYIASAA